MMEIIFLLNCFTLEGLGPKSGLEPRCGFIILFKNIRIIIILNYKNKKKKQLD